MKRKKNIVDRLLSLKETEEMNWEIALLGNVAKGFVKSKIKNGERVFWITSEGRTYVKKLLEQSPDAREFMKRLSESKK